MGLQVERILRGPLSRHNEALGSAELDEVEMDAGANEVEREEEAEAASRLDFCLKIPRKGPDTMRTRHPNRSIFGSHSPRIINCAEFAVCYCCVNNCILLAIRCKPSVYNCCCCCSLDLFASSANSSAVLCIASAVAIYTSV